MLHFQVQQCLPGSLTYCADREEGVLLDKYSKHCVAEQRHICFHRPKHSSLTFLNDSSTKWCFLQISIYAVYYRLSYIISGWEIFYITKNLFWRVEELINNCAEGLAVYKALCICHYAKFTKPAFPCHKHLKNWHFTYRLSIL